MVIANGTKFNDILNGSIGDDILDGKAGNDRIRAYSSAAGYNRQYDELTGGAGADTFVLTDEHGSVGYTNDDYLTTSGSTLNPTLHSTGFALIKDFQPALVGAKKDTIELDGFAQHYKLMNVWWGQKFGKADNAKCQDVALVYVGAEQDKQDVVAVLQDLSPQLIQNLKSGTGDFLSNNPNVFKFLG